MRTLYAKFVFTTIGIMIFSSILSFIMSNIYYQHALKPQNDDKTTTQALEITNYIEQHPALDLQQYLQHSATLGYHIMLFDEQLQATAFDESFRDTTIDEHTIQQVLNGTIYHGILTFPHQTFVTGFFANELTNSIGVPLNHNGNNYALFIHTNIKLLFNEMHFLFAALIMLMIVLSILFVLLCTKYIVKPITTLTKATESIANGKYDVQLDKKRRDELGRLSQSFMQMTQKLAHVEENRKEFTANISHDIQSPLSNIKGYVTLLEKNDVSQEERAHYMNTINGEIDRLSTLTNQLLQLTTLDQQEQLLNPQTFFVNEQIQKLLVHYQWQIQKKELMLSHSLPTVAITADADLLNMVWDNLLSNAIKYINEFGTIDIELTEQEHSITVIFSDNGIGISEHEQQQIFERFYRVDSSRTRTVEGTGLGLSIVWRIISLHNGSVEVTSEFGYGTTITVILPKKRDEKRL